MTNTYLARFGTSVLYSLSIGAAVASCRSLAPRFDDSWSEVSIGTLVLQAGVVALLCVGPCLLSKGRTLSVLVALSWGAFFFASLIPTLGTAFLVLGAGLFVATCVLASKWYLKMNRGD